MALSGVALSNLTPCPELDFSGPSTSNKILSKYRFISSVSSKGKESAHQGRTTSTMKFPSYASRAFKDTKKQTRKPIDGATILKAVPQSSPTRTATRKFEAQITSDSPISPASASSAQGQPVAILELHSDDSSPQYAAVAFDERACANDENSQEPNPDFLGIWKDGTVQWAHDPFRSSVEINGAPRTEVADIDSDSIDVPVTLDPTLQKPSVRVSTPVKRDDSAPVVQATTNLLRAPGDSDSPENRPRSAQSFETVKQYRMSANNSTLRIDTLSLSPSGLPKPTCAPRLIGHITTVQAVDPPRQWTPATRSASSVETLDRDRMSSYSDTSSLSSVSMDSPGKTMPDCPTASTYSVVSPVVAGVFDEAPAQRKTSSPKKHLSPVDLNNKPLPPEPLEMAPAPLAVPIKSIPSPPRREDASPKSASTNSPGPRASNLGKLIKSSISPKNNGKYSTTDLDSIDRAFQQSSPVSKRDTALIEAEEALEEELSWISEVVPFSWDHLPDIPDSPTLPRYLLERTVAPSAIGSIDDPLQISRGPMLMKPSRAAPTPPSSSIPHTLRARATQAFNAVVNQVGAPRRRGSMPELSGMPSDGTGAEGEKDGTLQPPAGLSPGSSPASSRSLPSTPNLSREPGTDADSSVAQMDSYFDDASTKDDAEDYNDSPTLPDFGPTCRIPPVEYKRLSKSTPQIRIPTRKSAEVPIRRGRFGRAMIPSQVSLAVSDTPEMNIASMPQPPLSRTRSKGKKSEERLIAPRAAETVLFKILNSLDNLQDLFSAAVVSKGFYKTYKRHELSLMKNALRGMSPAAWELREMTPPFEDGNDLDDDRPSPEYTPSTYLQYYTRDLLIMVALKSLILDRCVGILRPDTVSALKGDGGERSLEIDDAFWRVWTFCRIFGSNKNREDDITGQVDWLRGGKLAHQKTCTSTLVMNDSTFGLGSVLVNPPDSFGHGNPGGLSPSQLWDMNEIWTCLGVLVQGLHGKTDMAREHGVFDKISVVDEAGGTEAAILGEYLSRDTYVQDARETNNLPEEWVCYLLTLGPSVILDLAAPSEQAGPQAFILAADFGLTDWEPCSEGGSRANFLKEAVTRAYQDQIVRTTHSRTASVRSTNDSIAASTTSEDTNLMTSHAEQLRGTRRADPLSPNITLTEERTTTKVSDVVRQIDAVASAAAHYHHHHLSDASTLPRMTLRHKQVDDPVDTAVWKLVGMGFPADKAKRALAETDTGENLDLKAAIDLCLMWTSAS
ncbi:MAG: hypothetical protein M1825_002379 [Sarcosagium campestre]|nr:MAG: hypothetical protein M1825_002379 [Sarcosagium campestre]